MTLTREQIKAAGLELDPIDREALAEELLSSIGAGDRGAMDQAWLAGARRRDAEFRTGTAGAMPVNDFLDR